MKKTISIFLLTTYTSLCFLTSVSFAKSSTLSEPSTLSKSATSEPSTLSVPSTSESYTSSSSNVSEPLEAYTLSPGDYLEVQILNHQELNTKQEIGPNGKIALPFLGRVTVAGMTLSKMELYVQTALGKYIDKPNVVVYLTPRPIYVVQHYLKTDAWVFRKATTIDEARAYAGEAYKNPIHYGDVINVNVGTTPSWWDNNWVAIITATAVITGIAVSLR
ncbi:MAG: polysaccharide biosynthesis/export family protein [Candidatus Saganbacteria bacterium]|nr:polysaccharide biosynthesis/export family protein [Candidatus Saganbacteria bacterium]